VKYLSEGGIMNKGIATIQEESGFVIILTTEGKMVLTREEFEKALKRGETIK
jgi:hypothetical protein